MSAAVAASRVVVLAVPDAALRERLRRSLAGMRWHVMEAAGGAEAMARMDERVPEAVIMDNWLPDLEAVEFAAQVTQFHPHADVLRLDGGQVAAAVKSPRRHELLHAVREAQEAMPAPQASGLGDDGAAWLAAPVAVPEQRVARVAEAHAYAPTAAPVPVVTIGEMIGQTPAMLELARLIRLVAPRTTSVLIEGETGAGKEVVAKAVHALSPRSQKSFAVLNCAAIPEALLEAELFGHTRGAFTGAVTSRTGRIEAAHGGTLFLDEIGEMPLPLQAKMLRFLECGEIQRVGDNETMRVDVRVIAATHQPLQQRSSEGAFRLDLYHRLAVFPLRVPALRERIDDLPLLAESMLEAMGRTGPRKQLSSMALEQMMQHAWPGNVRELAHVLERATILAGDRAQIDIADIRFA